MGNICPRAIPGEKSVTHLNLSVCLAALKCLLMCTASLILVGFVVLSRKAFALKRLDLIAFLSLNLNVVQTMFYLASILTTLSC